MVYVLQYQSLTIIWYRLNDKKETKHLQIHIRIRDKTIHIFRLSPSVHKIKCRINKIEWTSIGSEIVDAKKNLSKWKKNVYRFTLNINDIPTSIDPNVIEAHFYV